MPGREAAAGKTAEARRSAEGLLRVLEGPTLTLTLTLTLALSLTQTQTLTLTLTRS